MQFNKKFIKILYAAIFLSLTCLISSLVVVADEGSYKICTQNIFRLGEKGSFNDPQFNLQLKWLTQRMVNVNCSIVALQEVPAKNEKISYKILSILADKIKENNKKTYKIVLSNSNDSFIRNAFLVSENDFTILKTENWNHNYLPKLDYRSSPWSYSRGPLVLELKSNKSDFQIYIVTDHFKSKARGWKDPTGTMYELPRVLAAADIKKRFLEKKSPDVLEIFLGDRNTGPNGASAQLLQGRVSLNDFQKGGKCEISNQGSALCSPDSYHNPDMIPLIETYASKSHREVGTFQRGKRVEILDEIYVFNDDQQFVLDNVGRIRAGVEGQYRKGSDHLLSWVEVSLPKK